ncbi:MAG TPA: class I SAM-dependent methyltransferase [Vicinamibacterales bacterium]|nr:class I SAM-dependent methyltransferase [Vicinamibacterales bacterium]
MTIIMRRRAFASGVVAMLVVAALAAQSRHPVSGREIAPVMGVGGAGWLERPEREAEEEPARAIEALDIKPGMTVADIGAGSGYYTVRLARKVGADGKVYATDIQVGMLSIIQRRAAMEKLTNIVPVLGAADDPKLPPGSVDLALMVDVYHELAAPQAFVRRLREALKPDGRLVLIEFRKEDPRVPIKEEHKMSVAEVRQELSADGYAIDRVIDVLPWQHIIVLKAAR